MKKQLKHKLLSNLTPEYQDFIRSFKRFSLKNENGEKMLVYFADGKQFHGGLCDRFKGIVSLYHFCLCNNIKFRIAHTSPFNLSDYIVPNEYNWQISNNERITYSFGEAKFINLVGDDTIRRLTNISTKKQIHAYANRDITKELNSFYKSDYSWGQLFKQLFKPTEKTEAEILQNLQHIGGEYIAATFRFQNLLGDFEEYGYVPIEYQQQKELIEKCRNSIVELQNSSTIKKILVTSDSNKFLESITDLENTYAFPSNNNHHHIDSRASNSHQSFLKLFLDFYLISESKKAHSIGTEQMYVKTEFPMFASKLNNIDFEIIKIN